MQARAFFAAFLLLMATTGWADADRAALERPDGEGGIDVRVEGMPTGDGILFVSLYLTAEGYPGEWQVAYSTLQLTAADQVDGVMTARFEAVPAGWFVIAVLHDEDSNKEMATNVLGIPKEPYGFSQNPKSRFGPPSWDNASVWLEAGQTSVVNVILK